MDLVLRHGRDRAVRRRAAPRTGRPRGALVAWLAQRADREPVPDRRGVGGAPTRSSRAWPLGGFSWGEVGYAFHDVAPARALASVGGVALVTFLAVALNALARRPASRARARSARRVCAAQVGDRRGRGGRGRRRPSRRRRSRHSRAAARRAPPGQRPEPRPHRRPRSTRATCRTATSPWPRQITRAGRPHRVPRVEHGRRSRRDRPATCPLEPRRGRPRARTRGCSRTRSSTPRPSGAQGLEPRRAVRARRPVEGTYAKRHLVPFGEYVPFRDALQRHQRAARTDPARLRARARARALRRSPAYQVGTVICFESAFGYQVRPLVHDGAQVIVVSTNNRSYRRSANSAQHVAIGQMRAAETGPAGGAGGDLGHHRGDRRRRRRARAHARCSTARSSQTTVDGHDGRDAVRALRRVGDLVSLVGAGDRRRGRARRRSCAPADVPRLGLRARDRAGRLEDRRDRGRPDGRRARIDRTAMTENPDRIERTLEVLLYAPIGVGLYLKDTAPPFVDMFVARGPRRDRPPPRRGAAARHDRAQHRPGRDGVRSADGAPARRARGRPTRASRAEGLLGVGRPPTARRRRRARAGTRRAAGRVPPTTVRPGRTAAPRRRPRPPAPRPTVGRRATAPSRTATLASSAGLPIPGYDALVGVAGRASGSSGSDARRARRRCTPTKRRTGSGARFSARSNSSPASRPSGARSTRPSRPTSPCSSSSRATLRAEMRDQRGGALWATREARPEPLEDTLAALLGRDDASIVVGTIDGTIVGFGTVRDRDAARRHPARRDRRAVRRARGAGGRGGRVDRRAASSRSASAPGASASTRPRCPAPARRRTSSSDPASPPAALVMHHKLRSGASANRATLGSVGP